MNQIITYKIRDVLTGFNTVATLAAALILQACCSNPLPHSSNSAIPEENVKSFISTLADPKEDVHGVLLLAPDRHDKLVTLTGKLGPTKPCYWNPDEILTAEKTPVPLPKECLNENIGVLYEKQQILVITPATMKTKEGSESILFFQDLDHRVVCVKSNGMPC